jgi:uncharacterized RDD family membrane protein YckC
MPAASNSALDQPRFAGFGARIAAYIVDAVINLCVVMAGAIVLRAFRALGLWPATANPQTAWAGLGPGSKSAVLVAFLVSAGLWYFSFCHASPWQATFGKRLLKIYVAGDNGERIGIGRALWRSLMFLVLGFFCANLVSLITIAATQRHKGIHDFLAGTVVYEGRLDPGVALEPWRIAMCFGVPLLWLVCTFVAVI